MLYAYNTTTGEFSMTMPFETEITEGLTNIAPPKTKTNQVAVFDAVNEKWEIKTDYRFTHKMVKDNQIYAIENFGDIPEEYILITNEQAQEIEQQIKIDSLTMTPLDFVNVLVGCGLTLEQINAYLESNLAVKMQLTYCNSVYCGVVKQLLPITIGEITVTVDMVENAFIAKNQDLFIEDASDEMIE